MKKKIFYAYHRAGYDLAYAVRNNFCAGTHKEALDNLRADYISLNPSRRDIPDEEIFVYKIIIDGDEIIVNDGDYELDEKEKILIMGIR